MSSAVRIDRETLPSSPQRREPSPIRRGRSRLARLGNERTSRQQGRGLNFDSLRRYQPGDDVR